MLAELRSVKPHRKLSLLISNVHVKDKGELYISISAGVTRPKYFDLFYMLIRMHKGDLRFPNTLATDDDMVVGRKS